VCPAPRELRAPAGAPGVHDLPPPGDVARALALALAVLAAPIALGSLRARRPVARAAALRTLAGAGCLGGLALAIAALAPANGRGALLAAGGLAWGAIAAVTLHIQQTLHAFEWAREVAAFAVDALDALGGLQ
jgi:hypothetical protein